MPRTPRSQAARARRRTSRPARLRTRRPRARASALGRRAGCATACRSTDRTHPASRRVTKRPLARLKEGQKIPPQGASVMDPHNPLDHLLQDLEDGCEIVFRNPDGDDAASRDPLHAAGRTAADDAGDAYALWRSTRSAFAHAASVAAADRADAAHDALARRCRASAAG